MTKVVSFSGTVVDAAPEALPALIESGMFRLCEGEVAPPSTAEPEPTAPQEIAADEPAFDRGAFGADEGEDTGDLTQLTNARLREIAAERGIDVPAKANKAKIIELLEAEG